ncbi:MAG: hydantoinase B/oxoprolinase family protein, partial [Alphaproteobacteria bacterium]
DSILSGPAGGVVGMARTAEAAGFSKVIGFDMGGTSTDVAHYDGEFERALETEVAGVRMRAPMMNIHTVAAGGGSLLSFDAGRYRVGPDSAGAVPGPACYRRGGPLTVTDCNVMLGKIQPRNFPHVFGPGADQALDAKAVKTAFTDLAARIHGATGDARTPQQVAEGFLDIAIDNMANAIRKISVQRGHDVTEYVLNCFGGAGGQHACQLADALAMTRVLVHPLAGVLSAYGMGLAQMRALRERTVEAPLEDGGFADTLDTLATEARTELTAEGVADADIAVIRRAHIRYAGTDTALPVPFAGVPAMAADFNARHKKRFGFTMEGRELIVEALSVEAIGDAGGTDAEMPECESDAADPLHTVSVICGGETFETPVYERQGLPQGTTIPGPAIIVEDTGTTVVEPGWRADVIAHGDLLLVRATPRREKITLDDDKDRGAPGVADPVMLEIFNNLFMSIAEQMGAVLANTAYSVNIKERLDFSCAVFDTDGGLVANAPHMPVHLGSMGESVGTVIERTRGTLKPGDVYVLNDPYNGGTHLPDVTVVTPVYNGSGNQPLFYVASRGHHADIGGVTPGSMPPDSTTLDEEGVLIDCFHLIEDGHIRTAEMLDLLRSGAFPARNPDQNLADLTAQVAANEKGAAELCRMTGHFGLDVVRAYMGHVQDNAEAAVRTVIDGLTEGQFRLQMDCGASIHVSIGIDRAARTACIDFTGTSSQQRNNFNAPFAVTRAAVLYVFRTLVSDDIPLNAGCLKPLDIIVPDDCLLRPRPPGAVVAGNVETSQAVVDALFGALGVLAGSQGTMNNLTFGDDTRQYYETICGGAGAGPGFDGTDAVQTHMTNSRLTDPEVLEWRFPVLLENFAIRRGSGGTGRWRGGDGVIREIKFLEPMTAAILSERRTIAPHGLDGGGAGLCGETRVRRADGTVTPLGATDRAVLGAGDTIIIKTPGGGGFGGDGP